jgi:hypothetical protein
LPGGCDDNPPRAHRYFLLITNAYYRSLLGEQLRTPEALEAASFFLASLHSASQLYKACDEDPCRILNG